MFSSFRLMFEIFGLIRVLEPGFSVATELEFAEFVEAFLV